MSPAAIEHSMPESSSSLKSADEDRRRFVNLRGVQWRIDLGVLPPPPPPASSSSAEFSSFIDDLRRFTADSRRRYAGLRRRLLIDPHMPRDRINSPDHVIDNPLSQNPDSTWGRFFRNAELEKMVDQDLSRLYPEHGSYFQTPGCQGLLRRILLLWCLRHPEYGYKQGMHELLAPLLYVLHVDVAHLSEVRNQYEEHFTDKFDGLSFYEYNENDTRYKFDLKKFINTVGEENGSQGNTRTIRSLSELDPEVKTIVLLNDAYGAEGELGIVLSEKFMEHDAYCMFDALMSGAHGSVPMADFFISAPPKGSLSGLPAVIEASAALYHLLSLVDKSLYSHLVELGVEPQYFALRWLRVLFGREFSLEHLLLLWDEIFAADRNKCAQVDAASTFSSPQAALISAIAVSMILYLRSSLLATENATTCLKRLLNFPENLDIRKLIDKAKFLQDLALEANIFATSSSFVGAVNISKSMVVGHTVSSDSVSPKTPLHVVPDSYWEEKWRVLHREEELKHSSPQKQNSMPRKGWSEKVRLRLSRAESDPSPSSAKHTDHNSSVRRNLLEDLSRELGLDEDNETGDCRGVSGQKDYLNAVEVEGQNGVIKDLTFRSEERCQSGNTACEDSSVFSDTSSRPSGANEHENDMDGSSVVSNTSIDRNDSHPETVQEESPFLVSDHTEIIEGSSPLPFSYPSPSSSPINCTSESKPTGNLLANQNERKVLFNKFQWFWRFGRNAGGVERSENGNRTHEAVNTAIDASNQLNNVEKPSSADGSHSCANGKGEAADQNVMGTLRNLGQSMLENIQVLESVFQQDRGQVGSLENFSKNVIVGKGQATAVTALKELRKISNLLSEM